MKLISHILLTLLAINMFFSCVKNPMEEQLKKAENLMDLHPDSSLKILQTMNIEYGCPDLISARYALALAKARDKNYIFSKDDSLLRKGIVGFEKHGDKTGAMWSHFYIGVCRYNAAEYRAAQSEALTASDLAGELENEYACGKISELIADIYQHSYNYKKSAEYRSRAIIHYLNSRKNEFARYASVDLANTCVKNGDTSRARHILDSIGAAINPDERYFNVYLQASYIPLLMKEGRNDEAYSLYSCMRGDTKESIYELLNITIIAELLIKVDKVEKEWYVFNDMESKYRHSIDEESYHLVKSMYHTHAGDYKQAIEETYKADSVHNVKLYDTLNENLLEAEKEHTARLLEKSKDSISNISKLLFITIAMLVLLIPAWFLVSMITKKRMTRKIEEQMLLAKDLEINIEKERKENERINNEKYETLLNEVEEKTEHLRDLQDKIAEMQTIVNNLRKEQENNGIIESIHKKQLLELSRSYFSILSELGNAYFDSCTSKKDSPYLRDAFEKKIKIMKSEEFQNLLFTGINNCHNNILNEFKEEFPNLKKRYLSFFAYQILRLSPKETCLLMDIKYPSFYTIQRRLKSYISESDSALKDKFLKAIHSNK